MSKAVLISIRPKWCELIASGKKTIEVRKTRPMLETPFKCYIYCTKGEPLIYCRPSQQIGNGKVIGEFVCDRIFPITVEQNSPFSEERGGGYSESYSAEGFHDCLSDEEFDSYLDGESGFGLHISKLKIYNEPKKLSEFKRLDPTYDFSIPGEVCRTFSINRPPQSWCYVKEIES